MLLSRYYIAGIISVQIWLFYIILVLRPPGGGDECRLGSGLQYEGLSKRGSLALASEKNLIIGVAVEYPLSILLPFVRSARATCGFCTIALFINKRESEDPNFIEMGRIYDVTWLIYEQFDVSEQYPEPGYAIRKLRWSLFSAYFGYLEQQEVSINKVFITDVDDVQFQTDVFQHINTRDGGLFIFTEHPPIELGSASKYRKAIISCFGVDSAEQLNYRPSFSSGTILGSWDSIKLYTLSVYSLIVKYEKKTCGAYQFDNHFHYYVVYVTDISNRTDIYHVSHENGFILTKPDPHNTPRNGLDLAVNANGTVYAVIHTVDPSSKHVETHKVNPLLAKKHLYDE